MHALVEAVDRFLDGDRDLELRRELAEKRMDTAARLVERALEHNPATEERDHADAMRELSRALALDPESLTARKALIRLLLHPPRVEPKGVGRTLRADAEAAIVRGARGRIALLVSVLVGLALLAPFMGIRDWPAVIAFVVLHGLFTLTDALEGFRGPARFKYARAFCLLFGLAALMVATRLFGPLILVPNLAAGFLSAKLFYARRDEVALLASMTAIALMAPLLLEYAGVLPQSYSFSDAGMLIRAQASQLRELPTIVLLSLVTFGAAVLPALNVWRVRSQLDRAHAELALRAWYLETLTCGSPSASRSFPPVDMLPR